MEAGLMFNGLENPDAYVAETLPLFPTDPRIPTLSTRMRYTKQKLNKKLNRQHHKIKHISILNYYLVVFTAKN